MIVSNKIVLSVVSHGQGTLVSKLFADLNRFSRHEFSVILTLNLPEDESYFQHCNFELTVVRNIKPRGFGANHNEAHRRSKCSWFVVVNPDIRIKDLSWSALLEPFRIESVSAVAPLIFSINGKIEDSARRFPTVFRLLRRRLFRIGTSDYDVIQTPYRVDWVAGMFVVFRSDAFDDIGGFDEIRFFMYLEDADICRRLTLNGGKIFVNPNSYVIHAARRASRRNIQHMSWHIVSAFRYLTGL